MTLSYNIKFASQEFEFVENTSMTKTENSQRLLSKNQKIIVQISIKAANNVIIFNITDFSDVIVSNLVDVLQKKIDEIAKRRRIVLLQKTLRKIKIEKTIEFCALSMFDEIMTLFIKSKFNAKHHREKLYRMMNSKRYFDENQQNLKRFLRKCVTIFQMKSFIYKKNLIRMIYVQNFLFDRSTKKW